MIRAGMPERPEVPFEVGLFIRMMNDLRSPMERKAAGVMTTFRRLLEVMLKRLVSAECT